MSSLAPKRAVASDRITDLTIVRLFVGEQSGFFGRKQGNPDSVIEAITEQCTIYL